MSLNDIGFLFVVLLLTQELCLSPCVNSPCHRLPLTNIQVRGVKFWSGVRKRKGVFVFHTLFEDSEIFIGFEQRLNIADFVSWGRLPQTSPV